MLHCSQKHDCRNGADVTHLHYGAGTHHAPKYLLVAANNGLETDADSTFTEPYHFRRHQSKIVDILEFKRSSRFDLYEKLVKKQNLKK